MKKIALAIGMIFMVMLMGCVTTPAQQGQDESRVATVTGTYIEQFNVSINGDTLPASALRVGDVNMAESANIDQSTTSQPNAEGTASAESTPTVEVPIKLTPSP